MSAIAHDFYAITGIGWGRGATAAEAVENYRKAIKRNWGKNAKALLDGPDASWGFVWKPPTGTTGFYSDSAIHWTGDIDEVDAQAHQRVADLGPVPAEFSVDFDADAMEAKHSQEA